MSITLNSRQQKEYDELLLNLFKYADMGDQNSMRECLEEALELGYEIGANPY